MKEPSECPFCGSNRLIKGKMLGHWGTNEPYFEPAELKSFKLTLTPRCLTVEHESYVCLDCGLVLGKTDPVKAQEYVSEWGSDQLKERVNL